MGRFPPRNARTNSRGHSDIIGTGYNETCGKETVHGTANDPKKFRVIEESQAETRRIELDLTTEEAALKAAWEQRLGAGMKTEAACERIRATGSARH